MSELATSSSKLAKADGSGAMFDNIAERYDLLNRIISLGIDQRWRRLTIEAMRLKEGDKVLDLATGTADLALMIAKKNPVNVVGLDPSTNMIAVGRRKAQAKQLAERVELLEGDAQAMPFEDNTFASACMAFGIRNVPDRSLGLRELARVVKPGGRVAILELSEPRSGILGPLARFHVHHVVPFVGGLLSGSNEYRYLQKSIAAFPPPETFAEQMREAGLVNVEARPLTFGVCCLYVGEAPA